MNESIEPRRGPQGPTGPVQGISPSARPSRIERAFQELEETMARRERDHQRQIVLLRLEAKHRARRDYLRFMLALLAFTVLAFAAKAICRGLGL